MSEENLSMEEMREFVPGTTAGEFSPGTLGYSAGSPVPIFWGTTPPGSPGFTVTPGSGVQEPTISVGTGQQATGSADQGRQQVPQQVAPGLGLLQPTVEDYQWTQGYLVTQIGRTVRIEFLIGESMLTDRRGTLLNVGIDYVVIQEADSDDIVICDLYSIKFVTTYL
jgi:hypothetical protein